MDNVQQRSKEDSRRCKLVTDKATITSRLRKGKRSKKLGNWNRPQPPKLIITPPGRWMATMETCYLLVEKKLDGGLRCGLNVGEHELQLEPKSGWISGGIKGLELNYEGCHCGLGKLAAVADQGHTDTWLLWMLCHKTHTGGRKGGPSPFCGLWPFCAHMHSNGHILLLNNNKTTISAHLRGNHSSHSWGTSLSPSSKDTLAQCRCTHRQSIQIDSHSHGFPIT